MTNPAAPRAETACRARVNRPEGEVLPDGLVRQRVDSGARGEDEALHLQFLLPDRN